MVIRTCECCHFSTQHKNVFDRHLQSKKHNDIITNPEKNKIVCNLCNKKYETRSGLHKHKLKCTRKSEDISMTDKNDDIMTMNQMRDQILVLRKELSELQMLNANNNKNIHVYLNT